MRLTILQDLKKDGTMVKGPTYQCYDSDEDGEIGWKSLYLKDGVEQDRTAWEKETEIYRAIKMSGLIVGLFRWRKINEVYSEQNKLVLGGCL